jgi:uncharacterized protein (TIGR03545 family)
LIEAVENMTNKSDKNKARNQSLIRWEAILPFTIFVLIIWAYFFLFFDHHAKLALEKVATNINGAEVNIANLKTSFWNASLQIDNIQVTDLENPIQNKIQIAEVHWQMIWDALLRGKIAIEDASIREIQIGVPRNHPGKVLPPPPPPTNSPIDAIKTQTLTRLQNEFSHNILGDVASILNGSDPTKQIENIGMELKSKKHLEELEAQLKIKDAEWKTRLAQMPQAKDFQALNDRIKKVKVDKFQNPTEIQTSLVEFNSIYKDAETQYKEVSSTGQLLTKEINNYQSEVKNLNQLVHQDVADLAAHLKIPRLDAESLSRHLFGPTIFARIQQIQFYIQKARTYMPPKKTAAEKAELAQPTPHERINGRNFKFGRPNSYPLFWLKHAAISSKANSANSSNSFNSKQAQFSGDIQGSLQDLTDDQTVLGRPTVAQFAGDFPAKRIHGFNCKIVIDHRTERPIESAQASVESFPILDHNLADSPDLKIGLKSATGRSNLTFEISKDDMHLKSNSEISNIYYLIEAKQPLLNQILQNAASDIPKITLNASFSGPWNNLESSLNSNLGSELSRALDKQFKLQINQAQQKVQDLINKQIGQQQKRLEENINNIQADLFKSLKLKQEEIDKTKSQINQATNQITNKQKQNLESQGKKVLEDLKKNFKF